MINVFLSRWVILAVVRHIFNFVRIGVSRTGSAFALSHPKDLAPFILIRLMSIK